MPKHTLGRVAFIFVLSLVPFQSVLAASGVCLDPKLVADNFSNCTPIQTPSGCDTTNGLAVQNAYDPLFVGPTGYFWFKFGNGWRQEFRKHCQQGSFGCPQVHWLPSHRYLAPGASCFIRGSCGSPIVIDLAKDGIHLGEAGVGVLFDLNGDGIGQLYQWVKPGENEAFLVHDLNGNGVVDFGPELFGQNTGLALEGWQPADNGFLGLAQFDDPGLGGNGDGEITSADAIWPELSLWLDSDADGISTPQEMMSLDDTNIVALGIDPKENNRQDPNGNWLPLWDWAEGEGQPNKMKMIDVFFLKL